MAGVGAPIVGEAFDPSFTDTRTTTGGLADVRSPTASALALATVVLLAIALLIVDIRFLWTPATDDVEGDVLIHLVFARNMAQGRWFEYGYQQPSRAGTSLMWEGLLAVVGRVTGQSQTPEGFLLMARVCSGAFLAIFAILFFKAQRKLNLSSRTAVLTTLLALLNPITFYWCIASPMETALAMVVVMLLLLLVLRSRSVGTASVSETSTFANANVLAGLTFLSLLVRPELAILCGITAIGMSLRNGLRPSAERLVVYSLAVAGGFVAYAGLMLWAGVSPIPNAGAARRLFLRLFDARTLPILHIPWSPDSWLFLVMFSPLVAGALLAWRRKESGRAGPLALAWLCVMVLFFSFYYYSSWRGRYLLPTLASLTPIGIAGLLHARDSVLRNMVRVGLPVWYAAVCAVCLWPLARHVRDGRLGHNTVAIDQADLLPSDHPPLKLMVQEVQCAMYDPNLIFISTDGLIDLKAFDAYRQGVTVTEFVLREKPDLIGFGRFYLKDPDKLEQSIAQTLTSKGSFQLGSLKLTYAGALRGGGPVLRAEYGASPESPTALDDATPR